MKINWRKIAWWFLIIFVIYAVYKSPEQAAGVVRSLGDWIGTAVRSVGSFFDGVLQG